MPFRSSSQASLCWFLYRKALEEGREPDWDCYEWERATKKKKKKKRDKIRKKGKKKARRKRESGI